MAIIIAPFNVQDPQFYLIECAAHAVPWSRSTFSGCAGKHYRTQALWSDDKGSGDTGAGYKAVGFSICHIVSGEITLMNIAVAPNAQGQGHGASLLDDIIAYASDHQGIQQSPIFLEVRESNQSAIALYRKHGFQDIGRRPNYYPPVPPATAQETAVVMRRG